MKRFTQVLVCPLSLEVEQQAVQALEEEWPRGIEQPPAAQAPVLPLEPTHSAPTSDVTR